MSAARAVRLAIGAETAESARFTSSAGACQLCGYDRCLTALDLHHLDPSSKEFNLSGNSTRRWAAIVQELRKCVLLCRNCHQEVHSGIAEPPPLRALPADLEAEE